MLGDLSLTSFAAWIGSLPLVAYYFHIVTPVSTPANVLAVPLCALVLISNLASLLLAGWFPAAAELFNHAGWFLMEIIRVSSHWFANWPGAYFYVPEPSPFHERPVLSGSAERSDRLAFPAQTARLEDRRARLRGCASGAGSIGRRAP